MTTLISVVTQNGRRHQCNSRCYNARQPNCTCAVCGGVNHGVGRRRAEANTAQMAAGLLARWRTEHGDAARMEAATQLALFEE